MKITVEIDDPIFEVVFSGHGSSYRWSHGTGLVPPGRGRLRFLEALLEAKSWELTADTIGGQALVVDMSTGVVHGSDGRVVSSGFRIAGL